MKKKTLRTADKALAPLHKPVQPSVSEKVNEAALLADLRGLIQSARQRVATVANATTTMLCWHVGHRLLKDNLQAGGYTGHLLTCTANKEKNALT